MSTGACTPREVVDTVAILLKQTDESATPPVLSSVEPAKDDDLDALLGKLSAVVISEVVPVKPVVPVRTRSWLEDVGFEQDKLDPIYLLAFLSRRNLPLRSNEIFKRELKDAIDKVQASRRPLLEAILDRVEVTDREVEDWELRGLDSVFTRDDDLLTLLLQDSTLSVLMIGETPRLSSAIGVMGNRGTTSKTRATCWKEPAEPVQVAFEKHLDRCLGEDFRFNLKHIIDNDKSCALFDHFSSSKKAQQFDATVPACYTALGYSYDIVFGHCLWPNLGAIPQDPGILLLEILEAVHKASQTQKYGRPVLVIFTIPDNLTWKPYFRLPSVIKWLKHTFQYLGSNRHFEDQLLGYGYRHEKSDGRGKSGPSGLHDVVTLEMLAHVFILRGKRNLEESEDIDP